MLAPLRLAAADVENISVKRWLELANISKDRAIYGVLSMTRFKDEIYVVNSETGWIPKPGSVLPRVNVPRGFVTDLASIPRVFFSLFRPDGQYAHAAVVHDWLYWNQSTSRAIADEIFNLAMIDLSVSTIERRALFEAVARFGEESWSENSRLRLSGERRVLGIFPDYPLMTLGEWKNKAGVFAE